MSKIIIKIILTFVQAIKAARTKFTSNQVWSQIKYIFHFLKSKKEKD